MSRPFLFAGFSVSGSLTLGHYCGLISYLISLQEKYEIIIMLADLHGLTTPKVNDFDYSKECRKMVALLSACGLKNCRFFIQSQITEHLELFWLLSSCVTVNSLRNMIQYKEKEKKGSSNLSLFSYPVLMAADILLYDVDSIVVGEDQKQHLELTTRIAKKFGKLIQTEIKLPNFVFSYPGSKIMSLKEPIRKMSKSESDSLFLLDNPNDVKKKIMSAKTDSQNKIFYNSSTKPGISNLLVIYSSISNRSLSELEIMFSKSSYSEFKKQIVLLLSEKLNKIRKEYLTYLPIANDFLVKDWKYFKEKAGKKLKSEAKRS